MKPMTKDNVLALKDPVEDCSDALTELLREGAKELIQKAVEAELQEYLAQYESLLTSLGEKRVVRNGYLPERKVQTGIGEVEVKVPRVRDREAKGADSLHFHSKLVPPYLRRTKSIEELVPWLYLKGLSTGQFHDALQSILGANAKGLSASTVRRLKAGWEEDYRGWKQRSLEGKKYVYIWADGLHFSVRMEEAKHCMLVLIGATEDGRKEFLALEDGYRESTQSWREVLLDLKQRGLKDVPKLAVGDGALGFWKALREEYSNTRQQRCWVHKTGNILNKMPKSSQAKAKQKIHDIWMAETREHAHKAFDLFVDTYKAKFPKAVECLVKDREELLAFYDFPAEHWAHLRTTNPIESTFATVRLRTAKTRGCLSRLTALTMTYKLAMSAQKGWRRLNGYKIIIRLLDGATFKDGVEVIRDAA